MRLAAAIPGRLPILELLLQLGAKDAPGPDGRTALLDACQGGIEDSVPPLIAAGSNPNARDSNKATPLILAASDWMPETVRLLAPLSNIAARDKQGFSAIDYARSWAAAYRDEGDYEAADEADACVAFLESCEISTAAAPAPLSRDGSPRL